MPEFIPPKHNDLVLSFVKGVLPLHLAMEKLVIRPSSNCISAIRRVAGQNTVLMLNHSDRNDPTAAFALSNSVGHPFYYLSARELFDMDFGIRGRVMQACGAYSVKRGNPEDFESKEKTISLIVEGQHPLLMFPEGDVTGRDDEILPLKHDGLHNVLEAQSILLAKENSPPVYVLPIALYYEVQDDAILPLQSCLARLEKKLELVARDYALEARIDRVLHAMVSHLESHYSIRGMSEFNVNYRLHNICRHVATGVAQYSHLANLDLSGDDNVLLYSVRSALRQQCLIDHPYGCTFCQTLEKESLHKAKDFEGELDRLQQLLILASTLDESYFSLDTAWRIVDRMENLILGKVSSKGHRIVWMEAGKPINLLDYFPEFEKLPNLAINRLEQNIRSSLLGNIQRLKRLAEIVHAA